MQAPASARHGGGKEDIMRRRLVSSLLAVGVALGLAAASAPVAAAEMRYKIPFSFKVHGATLPAGTYIVSNELNVLVVRGDGLSHGAVAVTNALTSSDGSDALLVFHPYGDVYILRQAWLGGGSGREIPASRLERELKASSGPRAAALQPERVVVPSL
jgi:hypothetical protein